MAINFPSTAVDDEIFTDANEVSWICKNSSITNPGTSFKWARVGVGASGGGGGTAIHQGDTEPEDPVATPTWFNTATGRSYVWYEDGDSGQWVQTTAEVEPAAASSGGGGASPDWELVEPTAPFAQLVDGQAAAINPAGGAVLGPSLLVKGAGVNQAVINGWDITKGALGDENWVYQGDQASNPVECDGDFTFEVSGFATADGGSQMRGIQLNYSSQYTAPSVYAAVDLCINHGNVYLYRGGAYDHHQGFQGIATLKIVRTSGSVQCYLNDTPTGDSFYAHGVVFLSWATGGLGDAIASPMTWLQPREHVISEPPGIRLPVGDAGVSQHVHVRSNTGDGSSNPQVSAGASTIYGAAEVRMPDYTPLTFNSPLGGTDWTYEVWDNDDPTAIQPWTALGGTSIRDKLSNPATGTTDLAKKGDS